MTSYEKTIAWIVKIGLWVVPVIPLYITSGMLFPFITGKNFAFRFLIEILAALWVGLMVMNSAWRPRLTPLVKAATVFIVILFLADLFSPNPLRAFFSNYERMEGFMMLSHLYLYFLMLVSVFRTKRDWLVFLHVSLATSVIVAFIGLMQKFGLRISVQGGFRVDSTIGNPAYLASYLSFHVWIMAVFLYMFWQKWWARILYGVLLLFELSIIYFTATRGAAVALLVAALVLFALLIAGWKRAFPDNTRGRAFAAGALALVVALPIVFWLVRDTRFIRSSPVLARFASISLEDRTTQSRFAIWKMSWQGVMDRPILGWGQENYYLVFQRYFDPSLHSSEPWFDRSHNIFFDWLIHAGVLGLLSFLSMIAVALWGIWRAVKRGAVELWHGAVFTALFVSYFVQNLFVFDNLNTYLLFFGVLAWSEPLAHGYADNAKTNGATRIAAVWGAGVAAVLAVLVVWAGYFLHWKPAKASATLIQALSATQARAPVDTILGYYKEALAYDTFGSTEIREQLANRARQVLESPDYSPEEKKRFADAAIEEMRKETAHEAKDIKHLLFLASVLARAGGVDPQYPAEAERVLREAIAISPTKQILYFELAQILINQQRLPDAITVLQKAADVYPSFQRAQVNLLVASSMAGDQHAFENAEKNLDIKRLSQDEMEFVGTLYRNRQEFPKALPYYERLASVYPEEAQYRATLAALLGELGEYDRAIAEAREAARLDPESFGEEAEVFIRLMEERKK